MLDFILDKRKRIHLILIIVVIPMLLSGCDILNGKEPYNYPNSLWVCDEPCITLKIDTINRIKAWVGDEVSGQEFILAFGYADDVEAHRADTKILSAETVLFQGTYKARKDHFIIYVKNDNLWGGKYRELYFERITTGDGLREPS